MRFQRRFVLLMATGLFIAATLGAAGYAASRPNVSSANVDVIRTRSTPRSLGGGPASPVTILYVSLPAGSWVVTASATADNFGNGDIVRCGLYRGSTPLDVASTVVSAANGMASLAPIGAFKSGGSTAVSLRCSHDGLINGITIDAGAVLWAHRSSSLNDS